MARKAMSVARAEKGALHVALDFAELCGHGPAHYAPYCHFTPGWLIGYDGISASGVAVAEELLGVAPEVEKFRTAIMRAGNPFSITVAQASVGIRGENFQARVGLMPPDAMPNVQPDYPRFQVTDQIRTALGYVSKIAASKSERLWASAVLLKNNTCVGTDGRTIIEGYHGCNIQGSYLLPREFLDVLCHVRLKPYRVTAFGYGDGTCTFWFGNNAWLRCNTYDPTYPDTDAVFAQLTSFYRDLRPIPDETIIGVESLKPFLVDRNLRLANYGFNTADDNHGAAYQFAHYWSCPHLVDYVGIWFAATHGKHIQVDGNGFYWHGDLLRGFTQIGG